MPATPDRIIELGAVRLAHRTVGQGPDLVFLHGWPLDSATWRNVVAELEDEFTCHLFDLPGAGATESDPSHVPSLGTDIDIVVRAIDALELDRVGLVGHDSGGMTARYVAARLGDRVEGLVVAGSEIPGHHPRLLDLFVLAGRLPFAAQILAAMFTFGPLKRSRLVLGSCFGDIQFADGDFDEQLVRPLVEDRRRMQGALTKLRSFDAALVDGLVEVHAQIEAPTALVWGSDDSVFFPVEKAEAMQSQFAGNTRFVTIPGGKLFVQEEFPERLAEEIRRTFVDWGSLSDSRADSSAP